jgi:HD-GYP domain-containing protein (c-di-GMP phosphodiesterase class II)
MWRNQEGNSMDALKRYLIKYFEQLFILIILLSVAAVNYLMPYKLAFLNFYFIPILLAASYLGQNKSILGAVLCILMVSIYAYLQPKSFEVGTSAIDLALNIVVWAGFLILTGAVVGRLQMKWKQEAAGKLTTEQELSTRKDELQELGGKLDEYTHHLEDKVSERTEHLEKTKHAVESLKEKVEEALYTTMDPSVVKLIIENRLRTEKKNLSIMFADLEAFTEYSEERRPEMVVTELNRFLGEMEDIMMSYCAHIDKYMGDGIMAEFGAPNDHERHALLAVMASIKMQERVAESDFPWQMRIGIATGEATIGLIGKKRQSYTALGDVVNLASRIQGLCRPGTVTIDEVTYDVTRRFINAKRKTILAHLDVDNPELAAEIVRCLGMLDLNPDDLELTKKMGFLFLQANNPVHAHDYLRKAMEMDPGDDRVKLAFAEMSVKLATLHEIPVRGRKAMIHLYEIEGIRNPLEDQGKIPASLYNAYRERVESIVKYPENIILPVESLDGSVGHARVVGLISYALADALDLPDRIKQDILLAGYLCDIGKAIIPHHMINRTGNLSSKEFEEIAKHCREGVRVLMKTGYENELLFEIVAAHHENFNGTGYPASLTGDNIPIGARIVSVADAYDAMTSWRPYRDRWDYRAAFAELEKETSKGKFDPAVISALGKLLQIS